MISNWYDVLKKVMKMWESNTLTTKKSKTSTAGSSMSESMDAEDFYVFLYDEEDKSGTNQAIIKQGNRGFRKGHLQRLLASGALAQELVSRKFKVWGQGQSS